MVIVMTTTITADANGTAEIVAAQRTTGTNTAKNASAKTQARQITNAQVSVVQQNTREMVTVMTTTITADVNTMEAIAVEPQERQTSLGTAKIASVKTQVTIQQNVQESAEWGNTLEMATAMTKTTTADASMMAVTAAETMEKLTSTSTVKIASAKTQMQNQPQAAKRKENAAPLF